VLEGVAIRILKMRAEASNGLENILNSTMHKVNSEYVEVFLEDSIIRFPLPVSLDFSGFPTSVPRALQYDQSFIAS
jgi:hypothetical protein